MHVYILVNTVNGKYYVGKTVSTNLNRYLSVKRWQARHGNPSRMPVVSAMAKYGADKFSANVLATADSPSQLDALERLWIVSLDARNPSIGYNVCVGGTVGRLGVHTSEDTKKKIGHANRGRKPAGYIRTDEHRRQLRKRMVGNTVGRTFTSETSLIALAARWEKARVAIS